MSSLHTTPLLLLLLLACGSDDGSGTATATLTDGGLSDGGTADGGLSDGGTADGGTTDGGTTDGGGSGVYPTPILSLSAQVLDPTLDGGALDIVIGLEHPDAKVTCEVVLELDHDGGVLSLGAWAPGDSLTWEPVSQGRPLAPGLATLFAWSACTDGSRGSSSVDLAFVRLAPAEIDLGAAEADDAVALAFHKQDLLTIGTVDIDGAEYRLAEGVFDDDNPVMAPWADPDVPPWQDDPDAVGRNVPAALVAGATPVISFTPADMLQDGTTTVPDGVTIELLGPSPGPWQAGSATLEDVDSTVGVDTLDLTWTWAACLGDSCTPVAVPGSRTTSHTVYRVAGPSTLRDGSDRGFADGRPWIGALADTAAAVSGIDGSDELAIMDALRDRINGDAWLVYNPSDSAYTDYSGSYTNWTYITSDLSGWLDRREGLDLWCHSVSCLLSVLGNHWGVEAEQIVIGTSFTTNLTRAAGTEDWLRWSFTLHSVATLYDNELVWDASVDLDGDDDPYNSPVEPLAPKGLPLDDYLEMLSPNNIGITIGERCYYR